MPQIFRIGPYLVFFWANESLPLEPVHVHVSKGTPSANATKVWITEKGSALLCNNNSRISEKELSSILEILTARSGEIIEKWLGFFGTVHFYC
ncbi:MAG: DUF4160 domain-containing protein [Fusobacteriaceae bacterium]|jgi:hypothetical protein|nr:DUF4160 domain-containing protein [Fusobacteriaceae bacterium]